MSDEQVAENVVAEEVSAPEEAPTPEINTADEPAMDVADEAAPEAEESEPEKVSKKSAQGRIKQLNSELKQERQQRSVLEEKINSILKENEENPFSPVNMPLPSPNQRRLAEPNENGEITYEDYQRDVQQNAQAAVKAILGQQKLKEEALDIIRNTPELDPNSESFDPDLSEAITEAVEAKHRLSANFSLKETVNKFLKPYKRAAEKAVDSEQKNIAQQVASAGVRPGASPVVDEKRFEDLSVEEMEGKLGKVY